MPTIYTHTNKYTQNPYKYEISQCIYTRKSVNTNATCTTQLTHTKLTYWYLVISNSVGDNMLQASNIGYVCHVAFLINDVMHFQLMYITNANTEEKQFYI